MTISSVHGLRTVASVVSDNAGSKIIARKTTAERAQTTIHPSNQPIQPHLQ
jgi:hypothetical protein